MQAMKKFIRYLYEYQNGRRVLNAGFVKAEESGSSAVLQIYGKGFPTVGRSMEILLFYLMGDQVVGISMGTAENVRPMFGYRLTYTPEDVGGEEIFQAIEGVIILNCASDMDVEGERGGEEPPLPAGQGCRWYAALWNDGTAAVEKMIRREKVLRREETDVRRKSEPEENDVRRESESEENDAEKQDERENNGDGVRNEQGENEGGIRKELEENDAGHEAALRENDERIRNEQGENGSGTRKELEENDAGKQDTREKNDDGIRSKLVENGERIGEEPEESSGVIRNLPEGNSREMQNASEVESEGQEEGTVQAGAKEDTQGEREIYKITRRDLAKLPRREWKLANNHFLMHGYRNYHYLVSFMRDGYCWLGVPGIYHPREQQAASAFGFGQFMRPDGQKNISGEGVKSTGEEFGYWCRAVGALIKN